jgi:hypothetical protein
MLEQLLFVFVVGGVLLLMGTSVVLLVRRGARGLDRRMDKAFSSDRKFALLALFAGITQLLVAALYLADNHELWRILLSGIAGVFWLALAIPRLRTPTLRGPR